MWALGSHNLSLGPDSPTYQLCASLKLSLTSMEIPLHCAKYIVNPEETVTIIITLIINLGRYSQEVHRLLEA